MRALPGKEFSQDMIDRIIGKPWDPKGTGMEQGDLHTEQPKKGDIDRPPTVRIRLLSLSHDLGAWLLQRGLLRRPGTRRVV